jgi:four helix bundle protein
MTRAAVSVCSNIAEGFGRRGAREKDQFYAIAKGSLTELENQVLIAQGIGYIDEPLLSRIMGQCEIVHKMLYGLQRANSKK